MRLYRRVAGAFGGDRMCGFWSASWWWLAVSSVVGRWLYQVLQICFRGCCSCCSVAMVSRFVVVGFVLSADGLCDCLCFVFCFTFCLFCCWLFLGSCCWVVVFVGPVRLCMLLLDASSIRILLDVARKG